MEKSIRVRVSVCPPLSYPQWRSQRLKTAVYFYLLTACNMYVSYFIPSNINEPSLSALVTAIISSASVLIYTV